MNEIIELAFESPGGIIDCRLEPDIDGAEGSYSATILYPNAVNGFSRSEIYCYNLLKNYSSGYFFEIGEEAMPSKIKMLESQISKAITEHFNKK